jgi:transposase
MPENPSSVFAGSRNRRIHLLPQGGPGRAAWPPVVLLKALILQSLYGLSDRELEEALCDRLSFRRFCGLSLEEGVPDHTVLCRFRNELAAAGLADRLFGELDRQLEKAGLMLKRGTMLDATLIATSSARPGDADTATDADARFARRQGKGGSVYGYKAHVGVDEGSGLIRAVITTPANVNDTTPADALIRGVTHHLELDAVLVVEIEPAAGLVVGVAVWRVAHRLDLRLHRVEIVDGDADMVQPAAGEIALRRRVAGRALGIDGEIGIVRADMHGEAVILGVALPADFPAEQLAKAFAVFSGSVTVTLTCSRAAWAMISSISGFRFALSTTSS